MPFVKGHARVGGRQKGAKPNRVIVISAQLAKDPRVRLEELGCDPLAGLARIGAACEETDPGIARLAYSDLASFLWARKKSVEVSGSVDVNHSITGARQVLADRVAGIRQRVGAAGVLQLPDGRAGG
jgi:hypothetical protein